MPAIAQYQSTAYLLSPPVRDLLTENRERGHVHLMSAFRAGLGENPRQKLDLLWHIAKCESTVVVQANEPPLWPGKIGEVGGTYSVDSPADGAIVHIAVERSCYKTPWARLPVDLRAELERRGPDGKKLGKAYRARPVIVPEPERLDWAAARLSFIGLAAQAESITVGTLQFANLGAKKQGIPFVEIQARARVVDAGKFADALERGTGKGRNYGLGLVRLLPTI